MITATYSPSKLQIKQYNIEIWQRDYDQTNNQIEEERHQSKQESHPKNLSKPQVNVTFLGRCVPFMFSALKKYLKESKNSQHQNAFKLICNMQKAKNTAQNPCRKYRNQSKLELGDLKSLIQTDRAFLKVWQEFLESPFLIKYINTSKKIIDINKECYRRVSIIMLQELQKPHPYQKFITQSNLKCLPVQQIQDSESYFDSEVDFEHIDSDIKQRTSNQQ